MTADDVIALVKEVRERKAAVLRSVTEGNCRWVPQSFIDGYTNELMALDGLLFEINEARSKEAATE